MARYRPGLVAGIAIMAGLLGIKGATAETLTLRAGHWCPYNCEPGSARPGYMIEIAEAAFAGTDIEIDYQIMPWARAIAEVEAGRIDGIVGATIADAPNALLPKLAMGRSAVAVLVRRDVGFVYRGPSSLATLSLAVFQGDTYDGGGDIDRFIRGAIAEHPPWLTVTSAENGVATDIRLVLAGRVDATIEDRAVLSWELAQSPQGAQARLVDVGSSAPIYIALSSANPRAKHYAEILDAGLLRLRATGRLKDILAPYGVEDWQ
jgi:polar amino acid transport system substrate-binding protein